MIETYNNIIFWVGYGTILLVLSTISIACIVLLVYRIVKFKRIRNIIFGIVIIAEIKEMNDKDYYKLRNEMERLRTRVKKND